MRVSPEDLAVLEEFISVRPERKTPWWAMMLDALVRDLVDAREQNARDADELEGRSKRATLMHETIERLSQEVADIRQAANEELEVVRGHRDEAEKHVKNAIRALDYYAANKEIGAVAQQALDRLKGN